MDSRNSTQPQRARAYEVAYSDSEAKVRHQPANNAYNSYQPWVNSIDGFAYQKPSENQQFASFAPSAPADLQLQGSKLRKDYSASYYGSTPSLTQQHTASHTASRDMYHASTVDVRRTPSTSNILSTEKDTDFSNR